MGKAIIIPLGGEVADILFGKCLEVSPAWNERRPPWLLALGATRHTAAGLQAGGAWKNRD